MSRIKRLEFSKSVRLEIFKRAGGPANVCCEGCGVPLRGKPFEIDHTLECWEMEDVEHGLRPPLTAEDGKLLGRCCHAPKTAKKTAERAHGKRIVEKAARARKAKHPLCGSRTIKMDGTVIDLRSMKILKRGENWRKHARKYGIEIEEDVA